MSAENVQLVRGIQPSPDVDLVALLADDDGAAAFLAALAPVFHEDAEVLAPGGVSSGTYRGVEGLREGWRDWLAPWASYRVEVDEIIDAGDDVLVLIRDHGRRAGMTAEVTLRGAAVWTVRDGRITRVAFHTDRDEARAAVGLDAD